MNNLKKTLPDGSQSKRSFFWLGLLLLLFLFYFGSYLQPHVPEISYSAFRKQLTEGNVSSVTVQEDKLSGSLKKPMELGSGENKIGIKEFRTILPSFGDPKLLSLLEKNKVTINTKSEERSWFTTLIIGLLPWILIIGFFVWSSKRLQQRMGGLGKGGPFSFGKSKAKLYQRTSSDVTFNDVAGLRNAKKELSEIVDYLKDPSKFRNLGGELPRGILMIGPPGTGKTLMSRAVAGEANVPFYSISGSEFIEMFVGVGASRVRDLFEKAKKDAPTIIFIDELDSIGRVRGTGLGGGHDEREQTLNQILAEMDGFSEHESVVVIAATNRPDVLDPALIRPGRFDRRVVLDRPHKRARKEILEIHTRKTPLAEDVDLEVVAATTVGFSGADIKNLVNEAALLAGRKDKDKVEAEDFELALDKIRLGIEREDYISHEDKEIIAYHEAGHTLMAELLPKADPLKKVSIIPRGRALGATEQLPEEDRYNLSRSYLLDRIAVMLGGRSAEKLVFDDLTSGAGDDLKQATQLARRMVCQWGMSEKLGPVTFRQGETHPFLGREIAQPKDFSEETARIIDEEVRRIVQEMEEKAEKTIHANRQKLDVLAQALVEHETLEKEEVDQLLNSSTGDADERAAAN
ncbi:MAG: ATP-dependent zinc metalloprotease FtsH [Deltaproteobacteria bacterium]|nr:ATP-dependent zinc metalloprotease FtsH [Deltaproteobacteria bacterium]